MAIIKYRESPTAEWQELPVVNRVSMGYLPEEALTVTGNCYHRFAYDGWNWFIEQYGDQVTTKDITNMGHMFTNSRTITEIPFDLNLKANNTSSIALNGMFNYCTYLTKLPKINGMLATTIPTNKYSFVDVDAMFDSCYQLVEIPYDYLTANFPEGYWEAKETFGVDGKDGAFISCNSLRKHCDLKPFKNYGNTSLYYSMYNGLFSDCNVLDSAQLPVENKVNYTSNVFSNTFYGCNRIKDIKFDLQEDGTPYTVKWKNQTIDLSYLIGYCNYSFTNQWRMNFTPAGDTIVFNDADYALYKDHPDYTAGSAAYSRYNHDSAVATINSLPDASAYLATAGGTNTIKFIGYCGTKTDGGAINTLTDAEIAVAAAKGWTVSLV